MEALISASADVPATTPRPPAPAEALPSEGSWRASLPSQAVAPMRVRSRGKLRRIMLKLYRLSFF